MYLPNQFSELGNFGFTVPDDRCHLPQGSEKSEVLLTQLERIFGDPMANAAVIGREVTHFVILEFNVPSYDTDTTQQWGQEKEVNRKK